MLEELTIQAGQELAKRLKLRGKPVNFVRGEFDTENKAARLIVHFDGSRKKYMIGLGIKDIENLLDSNSPVKVFGKDYLGSLLFSSEEKEERFFRNLQEALMEERIGPAEYHAARAKIKSRLDLLYKEIYGDDLLDNRRRLGINLLVSGTVGLFQLVKSFYKSRIRGSFVPFLYAAAGFILADAIQRYLGKKEVIERLRIKPDDHLLGKYLGKATGTTQEQKVY